MSDQLKDNESALAWGASLGHLVAGLGAPLMGKEKELGKDKAMVQSKVKAKELTW